MKAVSSALHPLRSEMLVDFILSSSLLTSLLRLVVTAITYIRCLIDKNGKDRLSSIISLYVWLHILYFDMKFRGKEKRDQKPYLEIATHLKKSLFILTFSLIIKRVWLRNTSLVWCTVQINRIIVGISLFKTIFIISRWTFILTLTVQWTKPCGSDQINSWHYFIRLPLYNQCKSCNKTVESSG